MEFVTFEIAKKLKEKGFTCQYPIAMYNEVGVFHPLYSSVGMDECYFYDDFDEYDCVCPTISQVLKWLRNIHKIHIEIVACAYGYNIIISKTPPDGTDLYFSHSNDDGPNDAGAWDVYEEAVIAGIEYVIDNLI